MKQFLTPYDIANTIRMMRPIYTGTVVLVEGDTDARVYKRFFDQTRCRVIPGHGKSNVLISLEILERTSFSGILAIVDSDFWKLEETEPGSLNILVTDTHDLETMIIASRALDVVLEEFGSARKMKRNGKQIRKLLLRVAMPFGYIRWISSSTQDNLSLNLKNISFAAVIDTHNKAMRADIDRLISEVKAHSHNIPFDEHEMRMRLLTLLRSKRYDPWHVCRGHDMVHILSIGLRNVFGNRHAKSITYEQLDRILRISFGYAEFSQTRLYELIEKWEKSNPDYRILLQ